MAVVARFYVASITRYAYNTGNAEVKLQAVTRGEENKSWAAATPSGQLTMNISNPDATEWFSERLGDDVVLRFEDPADDH